MAALPDFLAAGGDPAWRSLPASPREASRGFSDGIWGAFGVSESSSAVGPGTLGLEAAG